jgi:hypothetical protein
MLVGIANFGIKPGQIHILPSKTKMMIREEKMKVMKLKKNTMMKVKRARRRRKRRRR